MAISTEQGWQLDETGARGYEDNLVAVFMDDWARDLLDRAQVGAGDRVLDVGTGTGIVARRAVPRIAPAGMVAAVDVNPAMLHVAREVAEGDGIDIAFHQAAAEDLPFGDGAFDVVVCQMALQFTDAARVLAEARRVLVSGGRVAVSTCRSLEHQPGYRILADRLAHHLGVEAATIISSPYRLGDSRDLVALMGGAGFVEPTTTIGVTSTRFPSAEAFLRAETASSPLGDVTERLDSDVVQRLVDDLAEALDVHTDSGGVHFPFETVTVVART